jgi:hypothetical protein
VVAAGAVENVPLTERTATLIGVRDGGLTRPNMKWEVRVQGPEPILKQVGLAVSDEEIRLVPRDSAFILSGSRLDSLADAASVRHEAGRIVTLLSSAARLSLGSREGLTVGDVAEARPESASTPSAAPSAKPSGRGAPATCLDRTATPPTWARDSSLSRSVRSALVNPALEQALALRDTLAPDWTDLAQLCTLIEGGMGGPAATARFGLTGTVRKQLLRGSAPPVARGSTAQAAGDSTPEDDRLPLKDALRFVDRLLMTWLTSATVPSAHDR